MHRRHSSIHILTICLIFALLIAGCGSGTLNGSNEEVAANGEDEARDAETVNAESETVDESQTEKEAEGVFATAPYEGLLQIRYFTTNRSSKSGDSILIQAPDGKTMMIDTGTAELGPYIVRYLKELNIDTIDIMVLTHTHPDHIGGFPDVARSVTINEVYSVDMTGPDKGHFHSMNTALNMHGLKPVLLEEGMTFELGEHLSFDVINPLAGQLPDINYDSSAVNEHSIVMNMSYKEKKFLFTGDINKIRRMQMLNTFEDQQERLKADFYDAPHHGIGIVPEFLKTVDPSVVVISQNLSAIRMETYNQFKEDFNIETYVTGLHGNILITSDGSDIQVITEKEGPAN